jgi:hypothetical protein
MQARLVSLAVGYAMGAGVLRRKGIRGKPWLELRRGELESEYLGHQLHNLRGAAGADYIARRDMVPGEGFYDIVRLRFHAPELERAMELLQVDSSQRLTPETLQVAGLRGLACIWLDCGRWAGESGVLSLRSADDARQLKRHLRNLGASLSATQPSSPLIKIQPESMKLLARELRPHVHRSMRRALWPGSIHGRELLARGCPVRTP